MVWSACSISSKSNDNKSNKNPMQRFKKILVGIDLAEGDRFVSERLATSTQNAIDAARWLAKSNSAELCFIYVLPPRAEQLSYDRQILMTEHGDYKSVGENAQEVLDEIVGYTSKLGISASSRVTFGRCWIEMIREVVRDSYDLVIAGMRKKGPFRGTFIGHTGNKLLRKCPCPVWITKTETADHASSILVAHDLREVGKDALTLGASLANQWKATLHILHAIELSVIGWADVATTDDATQQIQSQLSELNKKDAITKVFVISDSPENAILDYVESRKIDLVVMGTVGRSGVRGMIVGNTAEKVMSNLPCSVLAVKPMGFKSPVSLNYD